MGTAQSRAVAAGVHRRCSASDHPAKAGRFRHVHWIVRACVASQKSKRRASSTDVPNPEHRVRWAFAAMLFLVGLGLIVARLAPLPPIGGVRLSAPWVFDDFRYAVYYPTQAFWHGVNPYNTTTYLARYPVNAPFSGYAPATFLVYLPVGFLSLGAASFGYFVLSVILTIIL